MTKREVEREVASRSFMARAVRRMSIVSLLSATLGVAHAGLIQDWVATYDYEGLYDLISELALDAAGNVYVSGQSPSAATGRDWATVKYDGETGAQVWVARYDDGDTRDWVSGLAVDSAGDVYVTGGTSEGLSLPADCVTIKYDGETGAQLWSQRFDGGGSDSPSGLALDATGNVYVTGTTEDLATDTRDALTIKYDGDTGAQIWVSRYDQSGTDSESMYYVAVDYAGDVYVHGYFHTAGNADLGTIKYDGETGMQLWVSRYDGAGLRDDPRAGIAVDAANDVYVSGLSEITDGNHDYVTIKYDGETGAQIWVSRYDHADLNDAPSDVKATVSASSHRYAINIGRSSR